jgi:hypothetical protein
MRGALWLTFLLFQDEKHGRCPRKSLVKIRKIAKNIFFFAPDWWQNDYSIYFRKENKKISKGLVAGHADMTRPIVTDGELGVSSQLLTSRLVSNISPAKSLAMIFLVWARHRNHLWCIK